MRMLKRATTKVSHAATAATKLLHATKRHEHGQAHVQMCASMPLCHRRPKLPVCPTSCICCPTPSLNPASACHCAAHTMHHQADPAPAAGAQPARIITPCMVHPSAPAAATIASRPGPVAAVLVHWAPPPALHPSQCCDTCQGCRSSLPDRHVCILKRLLHDAIVHQWLILQDAIMLQHVLWQSLQKLLLGYASSIHQELHPRDPF